MREFERDKVNEMMSNFWSGLLRILRHTNNKKKSYTIEKPDLISVAYLILFFSIALYFVFKMVTNSKSAIPFLFIIPTFIGVFVFYILLPVRLLNFGISQIIIFFYLKKIKKNNNKIFRKKILK